jgi:hypothetical protein
LAPLEEEAASIRQRLLPIKRQDTRGSQQKGLDHDFSVLIALPTLDLGRAMSIYLIVEAWPDLKPPRSDAA